MKKTIIAVLLTLATFGVKAQNTFPTTGNVGIGTTAPKSLLHVNGDYYGEGHIWYHAHEGDGKSGTAYIQARDKSGSSNISIQLRTQNNGKIVNALRITNPGNVGIGTTAPKSLLHVNGDYYGEGHIWYHAHEGDGKSGTAYIQARDKSGSSNISIQLRTQNNGKIVNALRITNPGNVGIGTTAPKSLLHVNGDYYGKGHVWYHAHEGDGKSGTAYIQARDKSGSSNISIQLRTQNNGKIVNALRITNPGNVGIGTTAPKSLLHVNGDYYGKGHVWYHAHEGDGKSGTAYIQARDKSGSSNISIQLRTQNNGKIVNALRITKEGKVGIGTTGENFGKYKLAVEGAIGAREVEVKQGNWADFVFEDDYELKDLNEVESFINENKHLPDVPSEKEVTENGINLGQMDAILLQKIEELTLYMIEVKKENESLKAEIEELKKQ